MRLGAERRLSGALLQLQVAWLITVADFSAPAIVDALAGKNAHGYVGLQVGGSRSRSQRDILGSIETTSPSHAHFPLLSHRRGQHGCRGTHCEQTNEFHTLLFPVPRY